MTLSMASQAVVDSRGPHLRGHPRAPHPWDLHHPAHRPRVSQFAIRHPQARRPRGQDHGRGSAPLEVTVTDLLKGLTGGGWASLSAWILPSAVGIILSWFLVIPELSPLSIVKTVNEFSEGGIAATLLGSSAALGVLLSAASTPLYRILEGYFLWPRWLQARRRAAHIRKRRKLVQQLKGRGWQYGLALEALARYPSDDAEVTPTRLGNAIRTFELYGKSRFNLDARKPCGAN